MLLQDNSLVNILNSWLKGKFSTDTKWHNHGYLPFFRPMHNKTSMVPFETIKHVQTFMFTF